MNFLDKRLENYSIEHSQQEPELLKQLSKETWQKVLQPRMLSGAYQGRLLSMISKLVLPKQILEIGTYTGYSTLCLAEGLSKDGQLHTIDVNEELQSIQQKYFNKSEHKSKIISHLGEAKTIIPTLDLTFDLVFIDADKINYGLYMDLIIPKLNPGAVILSDNVLWSGKVVDADAKDEDTMALKTYNKKLNAHPHLETVLLPIRDGLSMSRYKI